MILVCKISTKMRIGYVNNVLELVLLVKIEDILNVHNEQQVLYQLTLVHSWVFVIAQT